jgi:hypothetical protein
MSPQSSSLLIARMPNHQEILRFMLVASACDRSSRPTSSSNPGTLANQRQSVASPLDPGGTIRLRPTPTLENR